MKLSPRREFEWDRTPGEGPGGRQPFMAGPRAKPMRECTRRLLLAALTVALAAGPAAAQTVVEDPEGDVRFEAYGQPAPAPEGWSAVDLVSLRIDEDPRQLVWTLQVAGYDDQPGAEMRNGDTRTIFQHGENRYAIQMGRDVTGEFYAFLHAVVGNDFDFQTIALLDVVADAAAGTISVPVPHDWIRDENGAPPASGRSITDIYTVAYSQSSLGGPSPDDPFNCCVDALVTTDRLPDEGTASHAARFGGVASSGGLRAWSDLPYRASNGADTAILYTLNVQAANATTVALTFEGVPEGWSVAAPTEVHVAAGETASISVLVTTPPRHQHGGTQAFTARLEDGAAWATAELGVHYLDIPQPAGHHNTLHFHVRDTFTSLDPAMDALGYADGDPYMNTLAEDQSDTGKPVDSTVSEFGGTRSEWHVCLSPGLLLGLDWNTNGSGELAASWAAQRPYGTATLSGELLHFGGADDYLPCNAGAHRVAGRNETIVARLLPSDPQELGEAHFTTAVEPLVERVPFQKSAALILVLRLDYDVPDSQGPGPAQLLPGGTLRLPLNEYRDDAPIAFPEQELPTLVSQGEPPTQDTGPGKDTPAAGPLMLALALGVAGWSRRVRG